MSKEYLEALKTIKIKCHPNSNPSPLVDEALKVVEQALQRLEQIDNAKPSEALKWLEHTGEQWVEHGLNDDVVQYKETQSYREIKQALIKAQEQEKVLEIIFEKNVDIIMIRMSETLDKYNLMIYKENFNRKELTQEEFDLVKKLMGKDKSE